jgi:ABC-type phosphate/phosphonate transport system ATPase subunit
MHKIKIKIKDGKTVIKVEGHAGSGCQALTSELEKALGTTTGDTKTQEYYQAKTTENNTQKLSQ